MITDSNIREQGYALFLGEVPELLQLIEQDLYSLISDYSKVKVHNLMRATHTIKGGAANLGLDTIKAIAHSLEDIFKCLYDPDALNNDHDLHSLLIQAYECLQVAITSEFTNSHINSEDLLNRASHVFAQIQAKLGDAFNTDHHIPSSEELGFDVVKAIFEVGVQQRIYALIDVINNPPNNDEFFQFLQSQVDIFTGLAQSLSLPGLEDIANTVKMALNVNPNCMLEIAQALLADLQAAQLAVLNGDRSQGGSASDVLKSLALQVNSPLTVVPQTELAITVKHPVFSPHFLDVTGNFYRFLITESNNNRQPLKYSQANYYLRVINYIFGWFNNYQDIPEHSLNLSLLMKPVSSDNSGVNSEDCIHYLTNWLESFFALIEDEQDSKSLYLYRRGVVLIVILTVAKFFYAVEDNKDVILVIKYLKQQIRTLAKEYENYEIVNELEKKWLDSNRLQKLLIIKEIKSEENDQLLEEIWGKASENESLNTPLPTSGETIQNDDYLASVTLSPVSETAISQDQTIVNEEEKSHNSKDKRNTPSFVRVNVENLQRLNYLTSELLIYQKRRSLFDNQIRELIEKLSQQLSKHQNTLAEFRGSEEIGDYTSNKNPTLCDSAPLRETNIKLITNYQSEIKFDVLEMDTYSDMELTLHSALEETLQIQETVESLDLLIKQAQQVSDQKQGLTLNIMENLVEARMLPLGTILNRFPQMVRNLSQVYHKQVELKLTGTDVLVDKAIAEKLYDPLLQLVRNAFDHGIETPEQRRELNKPERGLIEILANKQGKYTVIKIKDDGQGINLEKLRTRAIDLGIIGVTEEIEDSELITLMFSPGFSTAGKVSEVSGRGMGLDIVQSQIQSLNGSVSVQSLLNEGTTFILKIPFSMTTDKLMLVIAKDVIYALLQDNIEKVVIPTEGQIKEFENKRFLLWRSGSDERMIVVENLGRMLNYNTNNNFPSLKDVDMEGTVKNPLILLRCDDGLIALEVDQIIGEQELVIRPVGNTITPPKYVYGCSSLANGNLILVLDGSLLIDGQDMHTILEFSSLPITTSQQASLVISEQRDEVQKLEQSSTHLNQKQLVAKENMVLPQVILVVDDAISLRQTLTLTLQKAGYEVLQAQNGIEALEQLEKHPEIEIIISDLEMPRMNGFELLNSISQNPQFANKPVVVLTSRSADKHRLLAKELGAIAYITKPYIEQEFLTIVQQLVRNS